MSHVASKTLSCRMSNSRNALRRVTIFSSRVDKPKCLMLIFRNGRVAVSNSGVKGHRKGRGVEAGAWGEKLVRLIFMEMRQITRDNAMSHVTNSVSPVATSLTATRQRGQGVTSGSGVKAARQHSLLPGHKNR